MYLIWCRIYWSYINDNQVQILEKVANTRRTIHSEKQKQITISRLGEYKYRIRNGCESGLCNEIDAALMFYNYNDIIILRHN